MTTNATPKEKTKRESKTSEETLDFGLLADTNNHLMENWAQSSSSMMKGAVDMAEEIMTFAQSRLQADIEAWKTLAACQNPGEMFECQREFTEKAAAQYLEETSKITARMINVMSEVKAPFQQ